MASLKLAQIHRSGPPEPSAFGEAGAVSHFFRKSDQDMLQITIVEDDRDLRDLLVRQINRGTGLQCLAAYPTAEVALKEIPKHPPDVVLMDIKLPGMNGIDCTRKLRALMPRLNIVMLTEHAQTNLIFEALKAGANGYLFREHATDGQIEKALEEVMAGGSPMTPDVARKVVGYFQELADRPSFKNLTKREREVLECLAEGWLYKQIADRLGISIDTARKHLRSIYRKLQVNSRTQAVVKYMESRK